jgi:hypothetical protein
VFGVEAAKCLPPRKLLLAVEVGTDNALVKGAALGIVWGVWLVERVRMSNQNRPNAAVAVRDSLDLEGAVLGWMNPEDVLRPARNRKL